ncbi:rhotekin isoform X3 [Stegostoma tigrinum]|uniref:rhotekin isoform X3 n=1 Tax=Stegostoma tigrinum TaxID=3053191 RepID=UPI002870474C|nr:rhotekin isoform X3 [Stegostoma tigrinum]
MWNWQAMNDTDFQKKIDYEIRMRDGTCKLLAACTQREQALEASKSLLTCNTRIMAYMSELQRMKEAQVRQRRVRRSSDAGLLKDRLPCKGKVAISDLRIPLMWKDTDYFKNKGDFHRYAVFALIKIGCEIYDTEMVMVDRTMTDISFESSFVFSSVGPDFEMKLEIYSCCVEEDFSMASAPKKLASKLSTSLGRSTGRKIRASLDSTGESVMANGGSSPVILPATAVEGPKYHLLAQSSLSLAAIHNNVCTQSLNRLGNECCSFWLPLYGSLCCQLAAQPLCMTQQMMSSFLNLQQMVGERCNWTRMYCVLQGTNLFCYYSPEEVEAKMDAAFTIAVNKETRIRATDKDSKRKCHSISITNCYAAEEVTHTLVSESQEEMCQWMEAFWQHFCNLSAWKQCCDELMKIDVVPPRKPPVTMSKQGVSLYHEMAIDSPEDSDLVTDTFVGGHGLHPWSVLFENTEKTVWRNIIPMPNNSAIPASFTRQLQSCPLIDSGAGKSQNLQDFSAETFLPRSRTLSLDSKLMSLMYQAECKQYGMQLYMSSTENSTSEFAIKPFSHPATD